MKVDMNREEASEDTDLNPTSNWSGHCTNEKIQYLSFCSCENVLLNWT